MARPQLRAPTAAKEQSGGGANPAPARGRWWCPGPGSTLRARAVAKAPERNPQAEGRAWGKKKRRFGTTVRDLNFRLHFPTVTSSYFQGIQIMQPRCLSGYHFKDSKVFFSQEMKKSFYSCFISTMILPSALKLISKFKIKMKTKSNLKWQTFFQNIFILLQLSIPFLLRFYVGEKVNNLIYLRKTYN